MKAALQQAANAGVQKIDQSLPPKDMATAETGSGAASSPATIGTHAPKYGMNLNRSASEPTQQPDKE